MNFNAASNGCWFLYIILVGMSLCVRFLCLCIELAGYKEQGAMWSKARAARSVMSSACTFRLLCLIHTLKDQLPVSPQAPYTFSPSSHI